MGLRKMNDNSQLFCVFFADGFVNQRKPIPYTRKQKATGVASDHKS